MLSFISNQSFYLTWVIVNLIVFGVVFSISGVIFSIKFYKGKKSQTRCSFRKFKLCSTDTLQYALLYDEIVTTKV